MHATLRKNERGAMFIASLMNLLFGVILAILALRFIFRLLGANPANAFISWIYTTSQPFISPFSGIFHQDALSVVIGTFEVATLVAIVVYGLIAAIITRLFSWPYHRPTV